MVQLGQLFAKHYAPLKVEELYGLSLVLQARLVHPKFQDAWSHTITDHEEFYLGNISDSDLFIE